MTINKNSVAQTTVTGGRAYYGEAIGILLFDGRRYPMIPGDVGNASSYRYPVRLKVVKGLHDVPPPPSLWTNNKLPLEAELMIKAAQELEADGVRAIVTACGFFAGLQDILSKSVNIPVFTSPLILIPLLQRILPACHSVGILTASAALLTRPFLEAAGVANFEQLKIAGIDDSTEFYATHMGGTRTTMDVSLLRQEVVGRVERLMEEHQDLGGILVECSNLPSFSKDIQDATGLPVFDFIGFIDFIYSSVVQREYSGFL